MMPDKAVKAKTDGLNQCFRISNINGLKTVNKTSFTEEQVQANSDLLKKVPVDKYIEIIMETRSAIPVQSKAQTIICRSAHPFGQKLTETI